MLFILQFIFHSLLIAAPTEAHMGERHMLIVRAGVDKIFVNYVGIIEKEQSPLLIQTFEFPLLKDALDFNAQEGLEKKDLTVNDKGFLAGPIRLDIPQKVISLVFVLPAKFGDGQVAIEFPFVVKELRILIEKTLQVESSELEKVSNDGGEFSQTYTGYFYKKPIQPYDKIRIAISHIPSGRFSLFLLGAIVAVLLIVCAGYFTVKTAQRTRG